MPVTNPAYRYLKIYLYALLGAGVIGVGVSLMHNLGRSLFLPFFPNVMDTVLMISVGCVLIYEVFKEALR